MGRTLKQPVQPVGQTVQQVLLEQDLRLREVRRARLRVGAVHAEERAGFRIRRHRAELPGHFHHALPEQETVVNSSKISISHTQTTHLGAPIRLRVFGVVHAKVLPVAVERNHGADAVARVDLHLARLGQRQPEQFRVPTDALLDEHVGEHERFVPVVGGNAFGYITLKDRRRTRLTRDTHFR